MSSQGFTCSMVGEMLRDGFGEQSFSSAAPSSSAFRCLLRRHCSTLARVGVLLLVRPTGSGAVGQAAPALPSSSHSGSSDLSASLYASKEIEHAQVRG